MLDVLTIRAGVAGFVAAVVPEWPIGMRLARPARSLASFGMGSSVSIVTALPFAGTSMFRSRS